MQVMNFYCGYIQTIKQRAYSAIYEMCTEQILMEWAKHKIELLWIIIHVPEREICLRARFVDYYLYVSVLQILTLKVGVNFDCLHQCYISIQILILCIPLQITIWHKMIAASRRQTVLRLLAISLSICPPPCLERAEWHWSWLLLITI